MNGQSNFHCAILNMLGGLWTALLLSGFFDGIFDPAIDRHPHGDVAGQTPDEIGNGLCQEDAQYPESHPGQ